jgi:hypothetical protein
MRKVKERRGFSGMVVISKARSQLSGTVSITTGLARRLDCGGC